MEYISDSSSDISFSDSFDNTTDFNDSKKSKTIIKK